MINREIIRLKIVQITYAYYQNGGKNIETAEKELFFSLSKAYDLYNYLLLLMVEINRIALRSVETAQSRYNRIHVGEPPSTKFVDNRFIMQLETNKQLLEFRENQKKNWANEEDFVRSLINRSLKRTIIRNIWLRRSLRMRRTVNFGARFTRISFVIMRRWTVCWRI